MTVYFVKVVTFNHIPKKVAKINKEFNFLIISLH